MISKYIRHDKATRRCSVTKMSNDNLTVILKTDMKLAFEYDANYVWAY